VKSTLLIGILGFIIVVGFIGDIIFKRWNIPSVIFLIIVGAFINNIFHIFGLEDILKVAPHLGPLAFAIILFEAGLHIDIYDIFRKTFHAFLFSTLSFVLTAFLIALVFSFVFGNYKVGLLMGITLGCTSGPIVIPVINRIKGITEDVRTIANLDSILSDIYTVIGITVALQIIEGGFSDPVHKIVSSFVFAFIVAVLGGLIWLKFSEFFIGGEISYMLTFGYILGIYWITEFVGGSGPLSSFILGLVISNSKEVFRRMKRLKAFEDIDISKIDFLERTTDEYTRRMSVELSFLFRTVFFLMLGLAIDFSYILNLKSILLFILSFSIISFSRWVSVLVLKFIDKNLSKKDIIVIFSMMPRGLITAVASFLVGNIFREHSETLISVSLGVIFITILTMSIIVSRISYAEKNSAGISDDK